MEEKDIENCIHENTMNILKQINENNLDYILNYRPPNKNEYICHKCHNCLFYNEINMGDSTIKECKIQSKGINLDELHHLNWINACNCDDSERLNNIYDRDCEYYSNKDKLYDFIKKEKERILKEVDNEHL